MNIPIFYHYRVFSGKKYLFTLALSSTVRGIKVVIPLVSEYKMPYFGYKYYQVELKVGYISKEVSHNKTEIEVILDAARKSKRQLKALKESFGVNDCV